MPNVGGHRRVPTPSFSVEEMRCTECGHKVEDVKCNRLRKMVTNERFYWYKCENCDKEFLLPRRLVDG